MNESVETNDEQDQENQTSVTDENSNAQNGDASVTDENSNAQSSSQDSNGSSNQEGSDASTSTDTGSQSDDSDESSDDVSPERLKELEEIATRGEDLRKRLANRLAHQGRERIATEKELEEERSKSTQLEAENKRLREQSQNRTTDTSQQNTGSDVNDDESDADTGTGSDEMTRLERENQELREQLTNTEAEEGGFYETLSTNPEVRAQQVEHNMKVMREALIATGDAEQNRQEREVHGTAVKAYTDLGIDVDTAEQIVALDIDAMEAENLSEKFKSQRDSKKLYADAMSKAAVRNKRQDDARKQQLQDRTQTSTSNGGQGATVTGDVPPLETEIANMKDMEFDEMMDHIEQLEEQYGTDFTEAILQRI